MKNLHKLGEIPINATDGWHKTAQAGFPGKIMLTQEQVFNLFNYDKDSGLLTWKVNKSNSIKSGSEAGTDKKGYRRVQIDGKMFFVHRIVWLWCYGSLPSCEIDHINGIKNDNRISNLREVTRSQNKMNTRKPVCINKTGYLGVSKRNNASTYRAFITVRGKRIILGSFPDAISAHNAYVEAKRILHETCTI